MGVHLSNLRRTLACYILCLLCPRRIRETASKASLCLPPKLGGSVSRDATTFGHPSSSLPPSNGIPPSNEIVGVVDWLLKRPPPLKGAAGDQRPPCRHSRFFPPMRAWKTIETTRFYIVSLLEDTVIEGIGIVICGFESEVTFS